MALLCMWAGLRRGEATALLWSDIDFKNKTIRVNKSYDFKTKSIKETKTQAGMRLVPLLPCLSEYLKKLPKNSTYVLGKRAEQWDWDMQLLKILRYMETEYGNPKATPKEYNHKHTISLTIPYFTWHELRHTYASVLYSADVDVLTACALLGHADVETTMGIYTHLEEEKKKLSIDKLNAYIKSKTPTA